MSVDHRLSLRVYYEDTDFSGRVYHASYLRFLERGRTEWLRALGFEHRALSGSDDIVFAVRNLSIEYRAPALMDDLLIVETSVEGGKGASITFDQRVLRDGVCLVDAKVGVVTLRADRAVRPPRALRDRLAQVQRDLIVDGPIEAS